MKPIVITQENFETEVLQNAKPVLVDFWAAWCGPCRMLAPILDEIAAEQDGFVVVKLNVDEQNALAQKYGVMNIPTLLYFKDGAVAKTLVGMRPKQAILDLLAE